MNSKQQGDMGEAVAIAYYTLQGYSVTVPLTSNTRYDLLIEKEGVILRVQCKCTNYIKYGSTYEVGTRTHGGNQSWNKVSKFLNKAEIDLLFVFSLNGKCYEFPPAFFDGKGMILLSKDKDQYKVWDFPLPNGLSFEKIIEAEVIVP